MKSSDVEEVTSRLLSKLGYVIESIDVSGKCVTFKAKSVHSGVEEAALVEVHFRRSKVGEPILKETMRKIEEQNLRRGLVFSMSDFTKEAVDYAQKKPIDLIDSTEYERLLMKHGLAAGKANATEKTFVYESAFLVGLSEEDAKRLFDSKRRRVLFFFGKPTEELSEVVGRFTPAAKITATLGGETRNFFINLHTGVLYYVRRDMLKNKRRILEEADFVETMSDLEGEAVSLFGEVVRSSQIPLSSLGLNIGLTIQDRLKILIRLKARKLVDVLGKEEPIFISNLNIPDLKDRRFDLEEFYETIENLKSSFESDEIKYNISDLMQRLALFFGGNTVLEKVMYLPYYRAVFIDSKSRVRYESLTALKEKW